MWAGCSKYWEPVAKWKFFDWLIDEELIDWLIDWLTPLLLWLYNGNILPCCIDICMFISTMPVLVHKQLSLHFPTYSTSWNLVKKTGRPAQYGGSSMIFLQKERDPLIHKRRWANLIDWANDSVLMTGGHPTLRIHKFSDEYLCWEMILKADNEVDEIIVDTICDPEWLIWMANVQPRSSPETPWLSRQT